MRAKAAVAAPAKAVSTFFTTYEYLGYAILDQETSPQPLPARGVGGTLTLQPNGTYQKRLTVTTGSGPVNFSQDGQYTFSGNHISFTYTDKQGKPRTDQGTFLLQRGLLTITLEAYPVGNQNIYTLRAPK